MPAAKHFPLLDLRSWLEHRSGMCRQFALLVAVLLLVEFSAPGLTHSALTPQDVVRLFCRADGRGDRAHPRRWAAIAPLVTWKLEPAWDQISLIGGYQVMGPRHVVVESEHEGQTESRLQIEIDVQYTLLGRVSAAGVNKVQEIESVTLTLVGDDVSGWRISAPPPRLHVFASEVDTAAMQASLQPDSAAYVSASAFVWRMLTAANRPVPYQPVSKLRDPDMFRAIEQPKAGDLALFLNENVPYHVGIVTEDGRIASATVNAGLVETSAAAFAGTALYLRLLEPKTPRITPSHGPDDPPATASTVSTPPLTPRHSTPPRDTPATSGQ